MGQTVDKGINNMLNIGKDMYTAGQAGFVGPDFAVEKIKILKRAHLLRE